ncbi:MAG: hypothetical protein HY276_10915 [Ignavibacteriales bacterium]|nr:hypothetical protein [Ignavibacteriales bacterium]
MSKTRRYIVAWDFPRNPSGTFYRVLIDEFGTSHPSGEYELIQRSVAVCHDDFIASRLAALAEHFGDKVDSFAIAPEGLSDENRKEARAFVERVLNRRLHKRGRRQR